MAAGRIRSAAGLLKGIRQSPKVVGSGAVDAVRLCSVPDDAERHLLAEIHLGTARLKREIGYNPSYFNRMVGELGPGAACRQLVRSTAVSDGFTKLWAHHKLDMTVEALVLLPWYASLFSDRDRDLARRRLIAHDFDVDGFLARRTVSPPEWATSD